MGNIYTCCDEKESTIDKIKKWESLYYKKQANLKCMELENEAILNSYISSIRRIDLTIPIEYIKSAYKEQKNKPKSKSSDYQYVILRMKDLFFYEDDDPKLKEIIPYGYDNYLYAFYYEISGHTIEIEVPNVERITSKNMYDMSLGKYTVLFQESKSYWENICSSYNTEAIKEDLHKAILADFKKEEGKNNEAQS